MAPTPATRSNPFATFLIIGPTCFFLGMLFALFPYDYNILWASPEPRELYYEIFEKHIRFIHASPPLISRVLNIVIGTGLVGFIAKLYKPSEANMLFDGASLVLYMCGVIVYVVNIVKGLRVVTDGLYDKIVPPVDAMLRDGAAVSSYQGDETSAGQPISREDSLKVLCASNTILALVLVGVLILQAGQWYAQKKEAVEMEAMALQDEAAKKARNGSASKKKQ